MPADKSYIGSWVSISRQGARSSCAVWSRRRPRRRDDADARRIADLYASFMDEAAVEKAGLAPLAERARGDRCDPVASASSAAAIGARWRGSASARRSGMYIDQDARDAQRYVPILAQDGLGLPDRDYYLVADDAKFAAARTSYAAYLTRLLQLAGSRRPTPPRRPSAVLALETALARGQWTRVENRDPVKTYNKIEPAALATLAPAFDWAGWLAATGLAEQNARRRRPAAELPAARSRRSSKRRRWPSGRPTCARACFNAYAPYLGKDFVDARFAFAGTTLSGTTAEPAALEARRRARRRLARRIARQALRRALLPARVEGAHGKARRQPPRCIPRQHRRARLDGPEATRQEAHAKLSTFAPKIGYPKRWIDYSAIEIRARRPGRQRPARARVRLRRATSPSSASRSTATSGS